MQTPWLSLCTGNWRGWRGWSRGHPTCRAQLSLQGGFSSKMRFSYSQGKKERSRQVRQRQALNSCSRRLLCHITHTCVYTHTPLHSSTPEGTVAKHHRQTRNSQLNGKPQSKGPGIASSMASQPVKGARNSQLKGKLSCLLSAQHLDPETRLTDESGQTQGACSSYPLIIVPALS